MARSGQGSRIFVNSLPKAGTHLLMTALDQFPGVRIAGLHLMKKRILRDHDDLVESSSNIDWDLVRRLLDSRAKTGQYVTTHIWGHPEIFEILDQLGYRSIFIVRDPRDIVVSSGAYIARLRRHPSHRRFTEEFTTDLQRDMAIINGYPPDSNGPGRVPLRGRLEGFKPWLTAPGVLRCRFEDLVGERGGGSSRAQLDTIREIGTHIGQPVDADGAQQIADKAWSPTSATFRAGVIGEWRERLDQSTLAAFNASIDAELLGAYGYEP